MKPANQPERLGDAPVSDDTVRSLKAGADALNFIFNGDGEPQTGFIILAFPFGGGEGHRCNYISNASRADVIVLLKEQLARFEGMAEPKTGRA